MRLIIDSHLDLAWNAASFDRDLTLSLEELRSAEQEMHDGPMRGKATVTFSEMRSAGMAVCIGTLLARSGPQHQRKHRYQRIDLDYPTRLGAYAAAYGQLACYRYWESIGQIVLIRTRRELEQHWALWQSTASYDTLPIGVILSMEGADPVIGPETLSEWWEIGLRAIEPAHYGPSHYAAGTASEGPLTPAGRELLAQMERLGISLDVTHLSDDSLSEALDLYAGPIWASHHNCRTLVPGDRQLTDEQIKQLCARDAVIGSVLDAWMLTPNWHERKSEPNAVTLSNVVDHIDHICQLAGSTRHCAIGSDLDGGFGTEQSPSDLNSIADLQKLESLLADRGYTTTEIDGIFHGNWLRLLSQALPAD